MFSHTLVVETWTDIPQVIRDSVLSFHGPGLYAYRPSSPSHRVLFVVLDQQDVDVAMRFLAQETVRAFLAQEASGPIPHGIPEYVRVTG